MIAHPGLPQIRTCAISAYGSSGHGFAARGIRHHHASDAGEAPADGCSPRCGSRFASSAIRCCRVDTISGFLSIRRVSLQQFRHLTPRFPSQGPFGSVPLLQRYYQDAPTPCRPSRRTSFPSLGGTTPDTCLRSTGSDVRPRGLGAFTSGASRTGSGWRRQGLPRSRGTRLCLCRVLRPRQDRCTITNTAQRRGPR